MSTDSVNDMLIPLVFGNEHGVIMPAGIQGRELNMKKAVAFLLTGTMLLSVSACNAFKKQAEESESETEETEETTEAITSESTTGETKPEAAYDPEWFPEFYDLCMEKDPENGHYVYYDDAVPGELSCYVYKTDTDNVSITYTATNELEYRGYITVNYTIIETSCIMQTTYELFYGDEMVRLYRAFQEFEPNGLEDLISAVTEDFVDDGEFCFGDISSVPAQEDMNIMYSRFIYMCEKAFEGESVTFADSGIYFGSKYKDTNPETPMSFENRYEFEDHEFEDGVCTDCGISWEKYLPAAAQKRSIAPGRPTYNGTISSKLLDPEDYTSFAITYGYPELLYVSYANDIRFNLEFVIEGADQVTLVYTYGYGTVSLGKGVDDNLIEYQIWIKCDRSEVNDYLSSPEKIVDSARFVFEYNGEDPYTTEDFTVEGTKGYFEGITGFEPLSQEELVKVFCSQVPNIFGSLDDLLADINTSFKDGGISYPGQV